MNKPAMFDHICGSIPGYLYSKQGVVYELLDRPIITIHCCKYTPLFFFSARAGLDCTAVCVSRSPSQP